MLGRFVNPKSVAVIGGDPAARVIEQLDLLGFAGEVWAVNPHRVRLVGRACLESVGSLPGVPDVAFVAVPRRETASIVADLAACGCGGVVAYASGFAESGDRELQARIVAAAGAMPLLGPNTYGYVNALDRTAIWPDVHGLRPVERGVAIVTQSGNIGINLTMARRGLDIGMVITAGNQAGLTIPDLVEALLDDGRVTAIGIQFEWVADGVALGWAALRAARQGTPLVALRMGTSDRGALATASHTGALAGVDEAYEALFRRYGIARTHTIPGFLEALKLGPHIRRTPHVVSLSSSGGEAAHVADLAHAAGVALPELTEEHRAAIAATVDPLVAVSNPMDYHTFSWGDEGALRATFGAVVAGPWNLAMLVLDFPHGEVPEAWWAACRAFAAAVAAAGVTGLVVATLPETMPAALQDRVRALGLVPMLGVAETIDALAALGCDHDPALAKLHAAAPPVDGTQTLDEAASKAVLAQAGVAVPVGEVTAVPGAAEIPYPRTVKVLGIDHKADAGAVAVGVPDAAALAGTLASMPATERYLVEETITDGVAELLVSVRAVDGLGWMLTIGAGGTLVEAFDDRAHLLVPSSRTEVVAALRSLRVASVLRRQRAGQEADVDAVVDAVMALQDLVASEPGLVEAEINPLVVTASAAVAADAMVTFGDE